eukprot:scaffold12617_cov172-Amphora_coffeaeformis.AAC.2
MTLRATGFSIEGTQNMISGSKPGCRSPYNAPSSDDSEDDGASDYAAHPRQRTLQSHQQLEPSDTILQRFYETVDAPCQAPCQVPCQGSMEDQLDLLMAWIVTGRCLRDREGVHFHVHDTVALILLL